MLPIGLNHMTVPFASTRRLLDVAAAVGCVGIELRNDLSGPLFDGEDPALIAEAAANKGLRILALAEVKAFNENTRDVLDEATALMAVASACGAEGIALIPAVSRQEVDRADQRTALRVALRALQPLLEKHNQKGLIEPLGFVTSTLRFKEDVVAVLDEMQRPACFAIIHDTFHHQLAGGDAINAELTALVHISGVTDPAIALEKMTDEDRVLVDARDRLGNIGQRRALRDVGYAGPASFEAFAPEIHDMKDPAPALAGSIAFINSQLTEISAGAA